MISIRKVESKDTAHVREVVEGILNTEFPSERAAYVYQDLDDPAAYYGGKRDVFYVAEKEGRIIGTIAVKEDDKNTALLRRVFVQKPYRGKGYGKRLLEEAMGFCQQHRYKQVMFHGTDKMKTALRLCQKYGFEEEDIKLGSSLKMVMLKKTL